MKKRGRGRIEQSMARCHKDRKHISQLHGETKLTTRSLHTLSAEELYTAHLTPYLQKATEEYTERIQKTQQENTMVFSKINDQRAEIERLLNGFEHAVQDLEGSVEAMRTNQQTGFEGLRNDVWQMEQEVAETR